jgi:hypothetical protein
VKEQINVLTEKQSPFKIKGVRIIYPLYMDSRLIVQSGFFTLHENPTERLEEVNPKNYKPVDFDIQVLRKWIIPKDRKIALLYDLERMAINTRTLYPDLDGLAKGLWQLEVIRKY